MAEKGLALLLALLMVFSASALGECTVERLEGEAYFPSEKDWVYHFTYAYPHLIGDDYASAAINDTYDMALDEMLRLVLPMFANEESMRFDGHNEVNHDFTVTCNNGRFFSVLQRRRQTMGDEGVLLTLEAQTFDVAGEYLGETLTLRGVVMVGDSSAQIAEAVMPVLYREFQALQQAGIARADVDADVFDWEFSPTRDFYTDENNNVVFFFSPTLLAEPSFDVPLFPFSPEDLEALL